MSNEKGVLKQIDELPHKKGEIEERIEQSIPEVAMLKGKEAYPFNDMVIIKGTATVKTIEFLEDRKDRGIEYEFTISKLNEYAESKGLKVGDVVKLNEMARHFISDPGNVHSTRSWYNKIKADRRDMTTIVREIPTVNVVDFYLISVHSIICYFR